MTISYRLGTRGSPLALTQARMTAAALCAAHGWAEDSIAIVPIRTSGDRIQDRPLAEVGGKALWTKELDRALHDGAIDFAVHSMKDVETIRPATIVIAAMLPRADVRDRLIGADDVASLPPDARVGTSSPRRAAQLRRLRPDVSIVLFRGNVDTRLAKLAAGEAHATLLAAAGLDRLGRTGVGAGVPIETMLPAPAQGAVGIETLAANAEMRALLGAIDHPATSACVRAERALLAALGADCRSPVGALAILQGDGVWLRAEILSEDGAARSAGEARFAADAPEGAAALAGELLERAEPDLRAPVRGVNRTLLILRPEPGAAATAARAAALGLAAVAAPLFTIAPAAWDPPDPAAFDAVMLTSANAVRHAGPALASYRALPAYAVGAATATAAGRAGFAIAATGERDGAALLERVAAGGVRRLLHLAGREHRSLDHPMLAITTVVLYAAEPVRRLPLAPDETHVALLHSPRAASLYRNLVDAAGLSPAGLVIAAISPAALAAAGTGWARSAAAALPTDDALLAAAAGLCD